MNVSNCLWKFSWRSRMVSSDDSRGRRDFYVFGCSILGAVLPIREWRCQDVDQVLLHEIIFFLSVFSSSEVLAKIISTRSELPTAACWSREKKNRGNCEANLLISRKRLPYHSPGTTDSTDKSFAVFSARWGVKFDRRVKISARWVS